MLEQETGLFICALPSGRAQRPGREGASLPAVIFSISSSAPPSGAQPELGAAGSQRRGRGALLQEEGEGLLRINYGFGSFPHCYS